MNYILFYKNHILLTGTQQESRLEFSTPRGKYKKSFDFRFEFRTKETEGILFYVSNRVHEQYAAVYLLEGNVSRIRSFIVIFKSVHGKSIQV